MKNWLQFAPPMSQASYDQIINSEPEELVILIGQSPPTGLYSGLYSPAVFKGQNLLYALYPGFDSEEEARTAMEEAIAKCKENKDGLES